MPIVRVKAYKCNRCDKIWLPRVPSDEIDPESGPLPVACARCKSEYWNSPRVLGTQEYKEILKKRRRKSTTTTTTTRKRRRK